MIFTALLGFMAPVVPEIMKLFAAKGERAHELAMFQMKMKAAAEGHAQELAKIEATADIEESKVLHAPMQSYGVRMMDAASDKGWPKWLLVPAVYLFILLDFLISLVRPSITYIVFGFYLVMKWGKFEMMRAVVSEDATTVELLGKLFTDQDYQMLTLVLSYWFGQRTAKYAFGWRNDK
jgi:hypothetical protein